MSPTVAAAALPLPAAKPDTARLAVGIAVGLLAALQFAPPSHTAAFPFAAMSIGRLVLLSGVDAAIFPALAPGFAALMAWPVLGHVPSPAETLGLAVVIGGLVLAVTRGRT